MVRKQQQLSYVLELSAQLEALRIAVDLALDQPALAAENRKDLEAIKETFSVAAAPRARHPRKP
jgi:hypothetical protein